jgi:hypothetical protein
MRRKIGESLRYFQIAKKLTPSRHARPTAPTTVLPFKITVKGAPAARRCSAPQTFEQ